MEQELIPDEVKKVIKDTFLNELKKDVHVELYTKEGVNDQFNEERAKLQRRHEVVVNSLRDKAQATQDELQEHLKALQAAGRIKEFHSFWITNAFRVDGPAGEIKKRFAVGGFDIGGVDHGEAAGREASSCDVVKNSEGVEGGGLVVWVVGDEGPALVA